MSDPVLKHLRRIERACYPKGMRQLDGVRTWDDLREYAEGEPTVLTVTNGYLIVTEDEIVDLAIDGVPSISDLFQILRFLRRHFHGRAALADLRESTSFRLVRALERSGRVRAEVLDTYEWCGETMHEVRLCF